MTNLFHIAFPVHDLNAARAFYGGVLGCPEGRSSDHWIDFDLYGHQIVAHLDAKTAGAQTTALLTATTCRCRISESSCR